MRTSLSSELSEDDLHLLYLDWCSAQVASRFLELTHDEVWLRSHSAATLIPEVHPDTPPVRRLLVIDRIPGYLDLVRKTALLLAEELDLPAFPDWKISYLQNPSAFDVTILGR
jgi:hypothetical protein